MKFIVFLMLTSLAACSTTGGKQRQESSVLDASESVMAQNSSQTPSSTIY